jgi:integrase
VARTLGPTTSRSRRRRALFLEPANEAPKFDPGRSVLTPAPPVPNLPQPAGPVAGMGIDELVRLVGEVNPGTRSAVDKRRRSLRMFAEHLSAFPGGSWQERWFASGWETTDQLIRTLNPPRADAWSMSAGFKLMAALRAIVPSVRALRRNAPQDYHAVFVTIQNDPMLDKVAARIRQAPTGPRYHGRALNHLVFALTSQSISMAELTAPALLHFCFAFRDAVPGKNADRWPARLIWDVLVELGHFPPSAPPTLRLAMVGSRRAVPQLVDQYGVRHPGVRQLLIDYLEHRVVEGMDYNTIQSLARHLVRNFWTLVEKINPDQQDLRLDERTYQAWRDEISIVRLNDGSTRPRQHVSSQLAAVRALYLDLQSWASDAPERWARWVAPCPISPATDRSYTRDRQRLTERMADRTRLRQPLLPLLVEHVTGQHEHHQALLAAALTTDEDATFEYAGRRYRRLPVKADTVRARQLRGLAESRIRLRDVDSGEEIVAQQAAKRTFWVWAIVEVLRLTGIRIEELLELTQLSVRQYRRPNGELVALLVVAPSKTDRERVIPMSPELLHVIAEIIRHHHRGDQPIPLVRRWDHHEREHSPALPFLFQHQTGALRQGFSSTWVSKELGRACTEIAQTHPEFADARFTPHDFRRIFATDLVNNGLPIHIGAALLGHTSLQTTRGYVAVFDEDVVRHYQQFLAHRRRLRPTEEYRPVTDDEWSEFEAHFDCEDLAAIPYRGPDPRFD